VTAVLVFGGTFDPVHNGHLAIARQARAGTGAEAVWFVPAALAPLRDPPRATAGERLELLEAACTAAGETGLAVSDIAIRRGGVSYTADVMAAFRASTPAADLMVLIGADAARTIRAWHRSADLLAVERFVIVNRAGTLPLDAAEATSLGYTLSRTTLLSVDSPAISASKIRARRSRGESLEGLVPRVVATLIERKGMYRQNRDDA
jgi:nicotinate-nucleotide adenylyltransferase